MDYGSKLRLFELRGIEPLTPGLPGQKISLIIAYKFCLVSPENHKYPYRDFDSGTKTLILIVAVRDAV